MLETKKHLSFLELIIGLAATAIVLMAVRGAADIVGQFLLAFVVAVAVAPIQFRLIRRGLNPVVAFLLTALVVIGSLTALSLILTLSMEQVVETLPQYQDSVTSLQTQLSDALSSAGISDEMLSSSSATSSPSDVLSWLGGVVGWLLGAFSSLGFMLAIAAFMLLDAVKLPERLKAVASPESQALLDKFVVNIRSYVLVTGKINLLVAAASTLMLLVIGVPFPLLWGVLAFLFGFIPSIGFILSLIGPAVMALLTSGPTEALIVIIAFIVVNGSIQNILLPRQMGEGTDLSPAVVFSSLVFWGWVLGPIGAILSVPMTMITKLALESADGTKGLAYLMSSGKHPYDESSPALPREDAGDSNVR